MSRTICVCRANRIYIMTWLAIMLVNKDTVYQTPVDVLIRLLSTHMGIARVLLLLDMEKL